MRALLALIKREYLEHSAAFVLAPAVLLGLMLLSAGYMAITSHAGIGGNDGPLTALKFYETMFGIAGLGWWAYLLVTLFFYFANAFSADRRNNAMLFWKSMPQSDLKILAAKLAAGLTVFPLAILLALGLTGVIAYIPAFTAGSIFAAYAPPTLIETVNVWVQIMAIAAAFFGLGLLWYTPFFAWVGMLSTMFGRWAMPLAVLIPGVVALFENVVLRRQFRPGGAVLDFLRDRITLDLEDLGLDAALLFVGEIEAVPVIAGMLARMDWASLVGGLAVAAVFIFVASEYRRRVVLT